MSANDTQAAIDVLAERARQIAVEGWTFEHDDSHKFGQIAMAAAAYAVNASPVGMTGSITKDLPHLMWPWHRRWWKPKSPRADLVRAGALILAEIERIDRREPK